jgi:hypothetical protein
MPPSEAIIRYVDNLLFVGGVPLPQFPGYAITSRPAIPEGWSTLDAMVLTSRVDPLGQRTVRAAVFRDDEALVAAPHAPIEQAERSFGAPFIDGEILADDALSGPDRTGYFRVRMGAVDQEFGIVLTVVGTVVAVGTARPSVGVVLDGPPHVPIEQMTFEIADALCRVGAHQR